jgi:hypothetical protein
VATESDLRERCRVDPRTGCWHWRGGLDSNGVPSLRLAQIGKVTSLGVAICWITTGAHPEPGKVWYTTCTTPNCANPRHRKPGTRGEALLAAQHTHSEQTKLRIAASRRRIPDTTVEAIKAAKGRLKDIAERYGVSVCYASNVRNGRVRALALAKGVAHTEIPSRLPPLHPPPPSNGIFSSMLIGTYLPSSSPIARAYGAKSDSPQHG